MEQRPLLSVVTVCFNSAATIGRTIASVREQTARDKLEYIVIDGGSTDGTLDVVRANSDVVSDWVSEPDAGIYDAMNKGIVRARGDWIHLLNSDDYYASPDAVEHAVRELDANCTNYFTIWRQFSDGTRDRQEYRYRRWPLFVSAFLPHPGLMVSRAQYEAVGLYDTRYRVAADHDMILRLTTRWPGLGHGMPLTVMTQGGYSEVNMQLALREFQAVTVAHGLPPLLARGLKKFKRFWWRI